MAEAMYITKSWRSFVRGAVVGCHVTSKPPATPAYSLESESSTKQVAVTSLHTHMFDSRCLPNLGRWQRLSDFQRTGSDVSNLATIKARCDVVIRSSRWLPCASALMSPRWANSGTPNYPATVLDGTRVVLLCCPRMCCLFSIGCTAWHQRQNMFQFEKSGIEGDT